VCVGVTVRLCGVALYRNGVVVTDRPEGGPSRPLRAVSLVWLGRSLGLVRVEGLFSCTGLRGAPQPRTAVSPPSALGCLTAGCSGWLRSYQTLLVPPTHPGNVADRAAQRTGAASSIVSSGTWPCVFVPRMQVHKYSGPHFAVSQPGKAVLGVVWVLCAIQNGLALASTCGAPNVRDYLITLRLWETAKWEGSGVGLRSMGKGVAQPDPAGREWGRPTLHAEGSRVDRPHGKGAAVGLHGKGSRPTAAKRNSSQNPLLRATCTAAHTNPAQTGAFPREVVYLTQQPTIRR